jgi:hypothetical protein
MFGIGTDRPAGALAALLEEKPTPGESSQDTLLPNVFQLACSPHKDFGVFASY